MTPDTSAYRVRVGGRRRQGVLGAYRVVDLTDERGQLCAATLASLGAEVIIVEPPGGSSSRRVGPFANDVDDGAHSLFHWSYNRGKQSVVIDLDTADGVAELKTLIAGADFLIDSEEPGVMAARGLGPEDLAALNPQLIAVSITPFGSNGPKANWKASDLTITASGGQMSLTGDDDRAPIRIPLPQAYHHGASEGAMAALIALYERQHLSGLGQHIDTSAQQSVMQASQSMMLARFVDASHISRVAGGIKIGPFHVQLAWPCNDGNVSVTFLFGAGIGPFTKNLVDWVHEEGFCDDATQQLDWVNFGTAMFSGAIAPEVYANVKADVGRFLMTKTKAELLAASFERRLLIVPVTTTEDVVTSPQFAARGFWEEVDHGGATGTVVYPGAMAKFSATPLTPLGPPAAVGADTAAVFAQPKRTPVMGNVNAAEPRSGRALDGLKVLDFMWVMAGPAGSRVLADQGATVVRLESANKLDTARTLQPFRNNTAHPDDSGLWNNMNASKLGLALDLSKPESLEVVWDLLDWCDVVTESFSPRGMRSMGLDYETLRERKPDLIMLSSCLMGQSGPLSELAGFGTMAAALSGFFEITGWPDRPPSGVFGAYTDYVAPRHLVCAVMAAIEHRRATGEGQYIDLSQAEATMQFLSPWLLDWTVNQRLHDRCGNEDPVFAPHGVFAAVGDDKWVAVAITSDEMWRSFASLAGRDDLAGLTESERRSRRDELDEIVRGWIGSRTPLDAMHVLQDAGVAAHQVNNTVESYEDPQLAARNHFVEISHAHQGTTWVEGPRFAMSRTPGHVSNGAPTHGQHLWEVLNGILGYDGDKIAELAVAEIFE